MPKNSGRIDDARFRSIRGWCLGCQIPMKMRRAMREQGQDCVCTYRKPFLHSLSLVEYHWDGPVAKNEPNTCKVLSARRRYCSVGGCLSCIGRPPMGNEYGSIYGGYYSYNPAHIKRMARWDHVHVLGVVSLFGDIAVHDHGFRSDIVRIDHLWVLRAENVRFPHGKLEAFLGNTYQCGVTMLQSGAADSFVEWLEKEDISYIVEKGVPK